MLEATPVINKRLIMLLAASFLSLAYSNVQANDRGLCQLDDGVVVAFANGVLTSEHEANRTLKELTKQYGTATANGETVTYDLLYNDTGGLQDFAEVFEQRLEEEEEELAERFELFFESLTGGDSWWEVIVDAIVGASELLNDLVDLATTAAVDSLLVLIDTPLMTENYKDHQKKLDQWVTENKKIILYAHSQGNLFANLAYDYLMINKGIPAEAVELIHVAPASVTTNGPHVLAEQDRVINALRLVGQVPDNTHNIPGYLSRPPGQNGKKDMLGHGLMEIYVNENLELAGVIRTHVKDAFSNLQVPEQLPSEGRIKGFFTVTLLWDGSGDVNLLVQEPHGTQVHPGASGNAGYITQNVKYAVGPERYHAS